VHREPHLPPADRPHRPGHRPGELLPELFWGLPTDDPVWVSEAVDPTARGAGSRYFPQHDSNCDGIDPADCSNRETFGDCDCLSIHAWP